MHRRVHLHGPLAELHSGPIQIQARTVAEAVEGITRQLKGFQPNLVSGRRRIQVVGCSTFEDLHRPLGPDQVDIHILPQMNGGKSGGFVQIGIGAALIALSFVPGMQAAAPYLIKIGAMLILGGIAQMLAPQPEIDRTNGAEQKSRYLGAPKNTVKIGTRIPILYGRHRVYGHYLSFDINAYDVR